MTSPAVLGPSADGSRSPAAQEALSPKLVRNSWNKFWNISRIIECL